tara:strand:+ start:286 stop:768 length:483 start_codon:yes stop_codon:yes gene_type:complete
MTEKSLTLLNEPFKSAAIYLLHLIKQDELPFVVFETFRDGKTQEAYFAKGVTKARFGQSPHNFGLAFDLVLDTKKVNVRKREWKGKDYLDAWDTETPEAVEAWVALGDLCFDLQLEWGGHWLKTESTTVKMVNGDEVKLGWDCPHVQLKNWRKQVKLFAN